MAGPFPAWSLPLRRVPTCAMRFATVTTAPPHSRLPSCASRRVKPSARLSRPGAARAAQQALAEAKLAARDCDVVEVDGLTLFDEAIALEAIGFAAKGEGLTVLAGDGRVNPSGGSAAGYCAPAMGLARIVEATLQLQGRAGANQLSVARRAIATGSSIVAAQTHTAVVLEAT